jgi:hypothetical protein
MLILDEAQVRRHLTYEALIPALESALIRFSAGEIAQPVRSVLPAPWHHGLFGIMPAVGADLMGVKLVTVFENNTALPTHQAVIQLFSATTGEPLATLDGRLITETRTAAVTAIAARLFTPDKPLTLPFSAQEYRPALICRLSVSSERSAKSACGAVLPPTPRPSRTKWAQHLCLWNIPCAVPTSSSV